MSHGQNVRKGAGMQQMKKKSATAESGLGMLKTSMKALTLIAMLSLTACGKNAQLTDGMSPSAKLATGIVGGEEATGREEFAPYTVALYDRKQGSLCTASILSNEILVTAAHCVNNEASSLVVIFTTNLHNKKLGPDVVRRVVSYETSPYWATRSNEDFNTGDIAVVRFTGGLPAGFKPAEILSDVSALADGKTVLLAGYGISDGKKRDGSGILRFVETTIAKANFSDTEVMLDQTKGKGACHGDSGGPAYVRVNGKLMLWGVTSRTVNDNEDSCLHNSAYTSIPSYAQWIQETANKLLNDQATNKREEKVPPLG